MFLKQWVECSLILGVGSGTVYTVRFKVRLFHTIYIKLT